MKSTIFSEKASRVHVSKSDTLPWHRMFGWRDDTVEYAIASLFPNLIKNVKHFQGILSLSLKKMTGKRKLDQNRVV